ncbi:hypothetical protein SP15_294 [Bacillus phage SP-15]|uniref:Uncharacterized protein n=1 Tax=Bacillus phage SP-15 TaxID=1792032 RepID=A0A127AWX2_9CAUD|nr:hypothetical protein SP15_294 [Bacillus phage SP-15]AMM45102.1 hypothetical protein SP15_294 [Bacillus phage SP-15]
MSGFTLENLQKVIEEVEALTKSDLTFEGLDKMIKAGARIQDLALLLNPDDLKARNIDVTKVKHVPTKYGLLEILASPYISRGSSYIINNEEMNKPFKFPAPDWLK